MTYPGRNKYKNGYIQDSLTFELEMLNSPGVQRGLEEVGLKFIQVAKGVYEARSLHDSEDLSPHYNESWSLKHVISGLIERIQVYNDDAHAEWVEFGSHAGGETAILKYRVMGRTADIMEANSEL